MHLLSMNFRKRIIQVLCIMEICRAILIKELYKFVNGLYPKLISVEFKLNNKIVCNTKSRHVYSRPINTAPYASKGLIDLGPKV